MNTKTTGLNPKLFVCLVALAACAALPGPVKADGHPVTVKISVSAAGLDLRQPAAARELYRRLYLAARLACGRGNRVGLESPPSFAGCYERALAEAVRSVNRAQLNMVYLAAHSGGEAGTYGIEAPTVMAAK